MPRDIGLRNAALWMRALIASTDQDSCLQRINHKKKCNLQNDGLRPPCTEKNAKTMTPKV
jgi:hypothetical protein